MKYYILDDDLASRKVLNRILTDEFLGEVIGESENPTDAELDIISTKPDIVLIDLLMPIQDGIETVQNLKKRNFKGKIIMISQIENKEMVAKAYEEGIEYFIHKPINRVEVSTVIRKLIEQMKMERSLSQIKESLAHLNNEEKTKTPDTNIYFILQQILGDLGVLGESGNNDLIAIIEYFYKTNNSSRSFIIENISLKEIYRNAIMEKNKKVTDKDLKAFEQRIRRTVDQAMTNLASLGLTDYTHPKFEYYATKFFDFNEIRLKMMEVDSKSGVNKGRLSRLNLKKFIYSLYTEMLTRLE